jgi:hypothetical protein
MVKQHPISVVLDDLLKGAPPNEVTLVWLTGRLQERSFGLVMLLMALVGLVPGASTFVGVLLAFPAIQMILAADRPHLPRFITSRRIGTTRLARLIGRIIPALRRMEMFIHPRWRTPPEVTKRAVGFVTLLLGATMASPFPFSHVVPALVIMLISIAYLEDDGLLLCISLAAALVSLSITATTVWATIRTADVVDRWLMGMY